MADAYHHSLSSEKKWGGDWAEYYPIHAWFDHTKIHHGDFRHRALRHHTLGIEECIHEFGATITLSTGREIPVRWIAERHIIEDIGFIPSVTHWLRRIQAEPWMNKPRKLSKEL
jgi:hypothetical protein